MLSCRRLSDHQTWPITTMLLSRGYHSHPSAVSIKTKMKNRRSAIISTHPGERRVDRNAREAFTNALYDMLKQGNGMHGLTNREDTYISVRELLNYQHFRMLSFSNLQKVVNEDRLHRFELLYQPLKGREADSWWIRVKQGEEKDIRLDPIIFSDNVGTAIYGTTLQEWTSYISIKGISRRNDKYIAISRGAPVQDYFTSSAPMTTQVLIHLDVKHAINMGIRFFLSSRPSPFFAPPLPSLLQTSGRGTSSLASHSSTAPSDSPSPRQIKSPPHTKSPSIITYKYKSTQILTPGNEFGFLPPECFSRVEVVRIKMKVLWTLEEETGEAAEQEQSDRKGKGVILDSDTGSAEEHTLVDARAEGLYNVQVTEEGLDQFFIDDHQAGAVHPDLKKEALAILSS